MKRFKLIKTFAFVFKDIRRSIIVCLILTAISAPLMLISPKLFQILVDEVLTNKKDDVFIWVALGLIGVYFLRLLLDSLVLYCNNIVGNTFTLSVRKKMWRKILVSNVYRDKIYAAGDLKLRLMDDVNNIAVFIKEQVIDLIYSIITTIFGVSLLIFCDPIMTLCCIWIFPLVFFTNRKIASKTEKVNEEIRTVQAGYYNSTFNAIKNKKEIKTQNAESTFIERFQSFRYKLAQLGIKNVRYWFLADFFADIKSNYLSKIFIYCLGLVFIRLDRMTIGTTIMFAEYFGLLFSSLDLISTRNALLKEKTPYFNRVQEILSLDEPKHGTAPFEFKDNISIRIQEFTYPSSDKKVLENISINITKGEFIAIVGESGCGKTTLTKLLLNIYSTPFGNISIDETKLPSISPISLYQNIAYVEQDDCIFNMTIRENMLIVAPQATDEDIQNVLEKVGLSFLLDSLENGLDTIIGETGHVFSGGQKQLFCIARTLLTHPQIIILDEATNALDQISEDTAIAAILTYIPEITLIAVSHKPSMIARANRVIDLGKVSK